MNTEKTNQVFSIFFFAGLFTLYYLTSFDKIPFGDCINYINIIEKGEYYKYATTTDHYLYMNIVIFFVKITHLPANLFFQVFDAISAVITLIFLFYGLQLTFKSTKLSYIGTLIFALSFSFWRMASTIEVCTFNSFFLSAFTYYSLLFIKKKESKILLVISFILGVSFWVHVQNIMLIPALFYMYYIAYFKYKKLVMLPLIMFIILSLGLYIPNILNKEDLINVYSSSNSTWIKGTFTKTFQEYTKNIGVALGYLIYNFWYFVIPIVISIFSRLRKNHIINNYFLLSLIPAFAFATFYNVSDNYVYFLGPYIILIFYCVDGILILSKRVKYIYPISLILAILFPVLYFSSLKILQNTEIGKTFDKQKEYKGGLTYYLLPWMNNNVGVLEFVIEKRKSPEPLDWMIDGVNEFVKENKNKYTIEEIKKM